jgi:two-component system response regulator HydG
VPFDVRVIDDDETAICARSSTRSAFAGISTSASTSFTSSCRRCGSRRRRPAAGAAHFIDLHAARAGKQVKGLSSGAAEKLLAYSWPGNVRELQNCIERAIALTQHERIVVEDLPETVRAYKRSHVLIASDNPSELVPLSEVERRYVLRVLEAVGGNKTSAAQILGMTRKTLYRKLEEYGATDGAKAG